MEILQDWVTKLPTAKQFILISSLRECDTKLECSSELLIGITNMLRNIIVNDNKGNNTQHILPLETAVLAIGWVGRKASSKWYDSVISAIKIIATDNRNVYTKKYYFDLLTTLRLAFSNFDTIIYNDVGERDELLQTIRRLERIENSEDVEISNRISVIKDHITYIENNMIPLLFNIDILYKLTYATDDMSTNTIFLDNTAMLNYISTVLKT